MARKRMFRLDVLETDSFMDMPLSTQALYFHLNLRADDDGFIGNPKQIVKMIGATQNDFDLLMAKRFILTFDDGVIVIKHWRMHNTLSANRYSETKFTEDKSMLKIKENNAYTFDDSGMELNDERLIELSKRQKTSNRQTIDKQKTIHRQDIDKQKTNNRQTKDETKTNTVKNSIDKYSIEKNNIVSVPVSKTDSANDLFERLWKLYPKKKGKGSVSDKRKKVLLSIGYDEMVRAIDRYKEYVKDKDIQYVKDGSTFFNSGYVDYLDENTEGYVKEDTVSDDGTICGMKKEDFDKLSNESKRRLMNAQ